MKLGVVFPQIEIGADPGAVRAYGQAVEQIGYHHILAYEHVVGANTASRPDWRGPYDIDSVFHEPFRAVRLPGRADRAHRVRHRHRDPAAASDRAGGQAGRGARRAVRRPAAARHRQSAGTPSSTKRSAPTSTTAGARCEEQVALLRALWTERAVTFDGTWHRVTGRRHQAAAGAASHSALVRRRARSGCCARIARLADGWMPQFEPDAAGRALLARMQGYARECGRDPRRDRPERPLGRRSQRRRTRLDRPRAGMAADRRHAPEHRHDAARAAGCRVPTSACWNDSTPPPPRPPQVPNPDGLRQRR